MQALRVWRYGPSTRLREPGNRDSRVRVFRLGQGPDSDIRVTPDPTFEDGPEIGNVHCTIVCTPEQVTVCDIAAAGPTWVNDICVVHGEVEVRPGNVITVGTVQLVVCGDDPNQQPDITAPDIPTLIAKTKQMYSAPSHQAAALKVPKSTYFHWLATGRFMAAAVLCLGLGGLAWTQSGEQSSEQKRPAAAASADRVVHAAPAATPVASTAATDASITTRANGPKESRESASDRTPLVKRTASKARKRRKPYRKRAARKASVKTVEEVSTQPSSEMASADSMEPHKPERGGTIIFERSNPVGGTLILGDDEHTTEIRGTLK